MLSLHYKSMYLVERVDVRFIADLTTGFVPFRRQLLVICCFFILFLHRTRANDSLIRFMDLKFITTSERDAFKSLQNHHEPLLELLCTPYGRENSLIGASVPETLNAFVQKLARDLERVPEKKKPIKVYEALQSHFLKHYALENSMIDVFEKGWFNCVSGTALHALVFDRLNIPYQIKEQPQHVFIIAYPGTHNIMIETTAADKGYLPVNGKMASAFVRYLHVEQIISENEFKSTDPMSLFNTYYYSKGLLSLLELTALQYCNYGVYASEKGQHDQALMYFKKAYYISPSKTAYDGMQLAAIQVQLGGTLAGEAAFRHFDFLCRLYAHKKSNSLKELILNQFNAYVKSYRPISQIRMNGAPQAEIINYADSGFKRLNLFIEDTFFVAEALYYHYEVARLKLVDRQFDTVLESHLEQLYALKPDDIDVRYLIFSWVVLKNENVTNSDILLKDIERVEALYPFLKVYPNFLTARYALELEMAGNYFTMGQPAKGDQALKNFESHYVALPGVKLAEKQVEEVYGRAASYYYRMGQLAKTREVLKRGLTVYPDHFGLIRRLNEAK